jgi:hypothetical protein
MFNVMRENCETPDYDQATEATEVKKVTQVTQFDQPAFQFPQIGVGGTVFTLI